jgi:hypothetical protein
MNIIQVIGALYRSDIDCGLESYRGSGVTAWVVDQRNHRSEKLFQVNELEHIAEWLLVHASDRYSTSDDLRQNANPHDMLAALACSDRRGPKRVERQERDRRSTDAADGTTS